MNTFQLEHTVARSVEYELVCRVRLPNSEVRVASFFVDEACRVKSILHHEKKAVSLHFCSLNKYT